MIGLNGARSSAAAWGTKFAVGPRSLSMLRGETLGLPIRIRLAIMGTSSQSRNSAPVAAITFSRFTQAVRLTWEDDFFSTDRCSGKERSLRYPFFLQIPYILLLRILIRLS